MVVRSESLSFLDMLLCLLAAFWGPRFAFWYILARFPGAVSPRLFVGFLSSGNAGMVIVGRQGHSHSTGGAFRGGL